MKRSPRSHPSFSQFEQELLRLGSPAAFRQFETRLPENRQIGAVSLKCAICMALARRLRKASEWFELRAGLPA